MAEKNPYDRTDVLRRDAWDEGFAAGVAAERERCLALTKRASHEPGAQGYSGEPKHTDMCRLAKAIQEGATA